MCDVCVLVWYWYFFFFFKQKTAYEMRISDWSSDVCSSDLNVGPCERNRARVWKAVDFRQDTAPPNDGGGFGAYSAILLCPAEDSASTSHRSRQAVDARMASSEQIRTMSPFPNRTDDAGAGRLAAPSSDYRQSPRSTSRH